MNLEKNVEPTHVPRLPRTVILLGWISFAADVSSEMIFPLVPGFLTTVLGAPAMALGVVEGFAQAAANVTAAASGFSSDRLRRRSPYIRWGYGLPVIGKALLALAVSWHGVLCGRLIDRLGKGLRGTARDALLADAIDDQRRGEAFGYHRSMDTAGAVVGVLLAGAVVAAMGETGTRAAYRTVFSVAAVAAACSFALTLRITEPPVANCSGVAGSGLIREAIRSLPRSYWNAAVLLNVFAFAGSSDAFLLLRASDLGSSALAVIALYALYNLVYAVLSYPFGALSDRVKRWRLIGAGWLLYGAVYLAFGFAGGPLLWPLFALYGVYMALTEGISKALIVDTAPAEARGAALGVIQLTTGFTALLSNVVAGAAWDSIGHGAPFVIGGCVAIAAGIAAVRQ